MKNKINLIEIEKDNQPRKNLKKTKFIPKFTREVWILYQILFVPLSNGKAVYMYLWWDTNK